MYAIPWFSTVFVYAPISEDTLEMDERLKGSWQTTIKDEELQKQFWEILPKGEKHGEIRCYIGAHFLREHNKQLD